MAQTRRPAQIIVVDDGSTDGSDALLREHFGNEPRVTLVCAQNGGQLHAFQRGVALLNADVACFLDSDDCWEREYLARMGALYDIRADIDFVFSDMQYFDQREGDLRYHDSALDLGYTAISTYLLTHWYGAPTSAVSMRANWARQVLDLPDEFRADWRTSPDNCLVYGASVLGAHKYYLPTGCVRYRMHGKNAWASNRSAEQGYLNLIRTRRLIGHYARSIGFDETACDSKTCKYEYCTKPQPPWPETLRYARLVMAHRVWPPWRKWEIALSVLKRGWRSRRA